MAKRKQKQMALPIMEFEDASLVEETQKRYLNYALSVITSRALPDARDGLKPVQRRIVYTMWNELRLRHDVKYRKSAAIVGDVMGKFHPHGDTAIYDALVRMAQGFTMQAPLVDGRGNFGSPDGDSAAAMRYTEARLQKLAGELASELGKKTVSFRPNYDGTRFEPIVLPARFPHLLVNGSQGIAVGMATSIPPHSLGETIQACLALIDDPKLTTAQLLKYIKGPDFPTEGEIISSRSELREIYESGHGSIKLRGQWKIEKLPREGKQIVISSIPYTVERRAIVEKIADVILSKKLPPLTNVRDESAEECRIVCEFKKDADPQMIMAYLFKHTPLQSNVQVNLTALTPIEGSEVTAPKRLNLEAMLKYFLDFRMEVVTKRLEFDLQKLEERIHILEGFIKIFDALDETIRIIRKSDGKQDAAKKLIKRFKLDELQVDAILELKLYKLAKLEILIIRKELDEKEKEANKLRKLLKSKSARWKLIRAELHELKEAYAVPRRSKIVTNLDEPEFDADSFIVDEDAMVALTQQGWVKRQQRFKDIASTRVRDGDKILNIEAGSTKSALAFFSNQGVCYVTRMADIPATTGYGSPVQKLFKLADGERIVSMVGMDPRFLEVPESTEGAEEPEQPFAIAVTKQGYSLRFSLRNHREPSTRAGRKYARLGKEDEVIFVGHVGDEEAIACATMNGKALICSADEVSLLSGAGKGVILIKLAKGDAVLGAQVLAYEEDVLVVNKDSGSKYAISTLKYGLVSRAGKGFHLFKRGKLKEVVHPEPAIPSFEVEEE